VAHRPPPRLRLRFRFRAVLAMRQAHGFAFGKSDLFFLVALEAEDAEEQALVAQEDEIEAVSWVGLEEYAAAEFTSSRPLLAKIMERCIAWADGRYAGLAGAKLTAGFSGREDLLLFGEEGAEAAGGGDNADAWIGVC
jgi:hypothetical protein